MTQDDLERLSELEAMLDKDAELDEDERAELRELRAIAREEKRTAKALAKFDKARIVWQVTWPIHLLNKETGEYDLPTGEFDRFYALDKATAELVARDTDGTIEEVARQALTGKFLEVICYTDEGAAVGYAHPDDEVTP
jgi:hypothetical protein